MVLRDDRWGNARGVWFITLEAAAAAEDLALKLLDVVDAVEADV